MSTQPRFFIHVKDSNDICSANHLSWMSVDGGYALIFECSGSLTVIPAKKVERIEISTAYYCGSCDGPLVTYPSEEWK